MQPLLRQAIARIDIMQGERSTGHGTGCLVAPDLVLTAMHVVANRQASPPTLLAGTIVLTFPTHRCEATVVDGRWDPRSDWALLRCATPPPGVRPVPLADNVSDGEEWETFGFPDANSRDGLAQLGTVENANGTFETVAAYQLFSRQAAAGVGAPVKGLSGGPVIVDGALVGVFRSSLMREGQFNVAGTLYACPVETILARCADLLPIPDPCRGLPGLPRQPLPPAPYRFLERFTARDAEIFFGRNREIRDLYDRVTANDSASIVLLYGQSGAGKSSFLDAGLLPRLASSHATLYVRRDRSKGLLRTVLEALAQAFPSAPADTLASAWKGIESATSRPLVVILDQVEEAFTLPAEPTEVEDLVAAVKLLVTSSARPQGRLVLGFRKEWLGEIQKPLDQHGLDYSKVFLEALDAEAVTEVATGLTHTRRLRDKYGLSVEDGLAASVASDLTADRESPVAPTLQVLLSRLWVEATKASSGSPAFTADLYARITREGVLLTDFLDHQLAALAEAARVAGGSVADVVESGLALDVLRFHVSRLGTAEERLRQQLIDEYQRDDDVAWLVGELKRLYLLTEPAGDGANTGATRLAHDTLAPAVRTRCDESLLPGQRARRLLEGRAGEWSDGKIGTPLDWRDLMRVEQGATGMRALYPDEERMVEASRAVRRQDTARRRTLKWAAAAAVVVVLGVGAAAWFYRLQNLQDEAWSALISLASTIPTVLDMQPSLGLVLAIDAVDRSLTLNNGVVPIAVQEGLAKALEVGRERFAWTLPAAGTATAIARDGRVAVGLTAGVIHVYRPGSIDPEQIIPAGGSPIDALSFSDDGELIAAARGSQGIGVWRRNGQPVGGLPQPLTNERAQNVAFVPGSQTLVALTGAVEGPNLLHLFDLNSRSIDTTAPQQGLEDHLQNLSRALRSTGAGDRDRPLEVILDGDNQIVVATEFLDDIYVSRAAGSKWTSTEKLDVVPGGTLIDVQGLALRRNAAGRAQLAIAANPLTVVDLQGTPLVAYTGGPSLSLVEFGANLLITAGGDGMVRVFDRMGPVLAPVLAANDIASLDVSADGEWAVVTGGGASPRLSILDLVVVGVRASVSWELDLPSDPTIRSVMAFLPTGQLVAAGADRAVRAWDLQIAPGQSALSTRPAFELSPSPQWTEVKVDAAGSIAILGAANGVQVFGPDGTPKGRWYETDLVTAAAMSLDGRLLVTGSRAGTVTLFDVPSGKATSQLCWSPMGSRSSGCPSTVRPRDQPLPTVSAVAIDPLSDRVVAAFSDGQVRAYRRDGTEIDGDAGAGGAEITALFFHPNGEIIGGTSRGEVRTIFPTAEHPARAVRVFAGPIKTFALHPSRSPLFIGGAQGLRAMDWPSGSLMDLPMSQLATAVSALAVSPDGRLLVAAKEQGGFLFWRAGWQEWFTAACDRLKQHELFTTLAKPGVAVDSAATSIDIEPYRAYDACRRRAWSQP